MKNLISATVTALALAACAPSNPQKMAPPDVYQSNVQAAPVATKISVQPKVDILFVIDNSASMEHHQQDLVDNINRFVEAFEADKRIDFHIGVTAVWDSRTYGVTSTNFQPLGQLFPIKNGQTPVAGDIGQNFVSRVPGYDKILASTLKIGVVPFEKGGPQFEELFTPILAAIDGRNVGFIRPEAHLAVVMLTDADDVSSLSPSKVKSALLQAKQGDATLFSTYAALSMSNCAKDPGNDPVVVKKQTGESYTPNVQIETLLNTTNGSAYKGDHEFNLCGDFGTQLAKAGRAIAKSAERDVKIQLEHIPEKETLMATLAGKVIFDGSKLENIASYDASKFVLTVPADVMANQPVDAEVEVTYTTVDPTHIDTPRVSTAL